MSTVNLSSQLHRQRSLGKCWQAALVTEKLQSSNHISFKVFQFVCHANNVVALWPQDRLPKRVKSASNSFHIRKLFCTISRGQRRMFASCRSCGLCVFPTVSLFHKPLTLEAKTEKQDFLKTEASEAETTHLHATCNPPSGPILCKEITKNKTKGGTTIVFLYLEHLKKQHLKKKTHTRRTRNNIQNVWIALR